jgi:hypothetical protein
MEKRRAKLNKKYENQVLISKPDGSFSQGIPTDYISECSTERSSIDATYIVDLLQDDTVTEIVEIYCRQRNTFLTLMTVQLVVEVILTCFELVYLDFAVSQMKEVYGSFGSVKLLFWGVLAFFLVFDSVYYCLGIYSAISMRLKLMSIFSYVCIVGVGCQMMAVYLHKFNFLLLFFRLIIYIYSRYMVSLISSILLLPG